MKELLRKLYKYIEPKLFDETFAQVDAERIELKLKVEELEDRIEDLEDYGIEE